jgi:hypothetical protein
MIFFETSALTGDSVQDVFFKCARQILSKIESGSSSSFWFSTKTNSFIFLPRKGKKINYGLLGVLDPQVMGSGVQHGDSRTAREIAKQNEPPKGGCCG